MIVDELMNKLAYMPPQARIVFLSPDSSYRKVVHVEQRLAEQFPDGTMMGDQGTLYRERGTELVTVVLLT